LENQMIKRTTTKLALLGLALAGTVAQAVPLVPEKSGWSGHINLGVGAGTSETNMVDGIASIDLGAKRISSLEDSPDSEDFVIPAVHFEVGYTLGDTGTQFYAGNQVADYLSFDLETTLETHIGVRQDIPGAGTVDFSLAVSSLPTDVWKDPYVVDVDRGDTERTSSGVHIAWDRIFGTPLELVWSSTEIELDDERSGSSEALGLSGQDQRLLRREGMVYHLGLSYDWEINERHRLVPGIAYLDFSLDGDAMKEDGPGLQLKYLYQVNRWRVVSEIYYQDLEADTRNPIFGDERQMETLGASITTFYSKPFGWNNWSANVTLGYQDDDSNIDFYDASFGLVSIGMLYRFD
jgi:hypothetical protein